ncbi:MAG TPA: DUF4189 domain-containing protein [Rhodanobacter sp.]|jgi:hypothetical protein|nr:DUF4189 domain-containing protein [Rhodanobacter sp.]
MKTNLSLILLAGLMLLPARVTYAQNSCAPGQYLIMPSNHQGTSFCAPIPRDRQGRPVAPQLPATHWGAIATDSATGKSVGAAVDLPSKAQAEQAALLDCKTKGGSACKIAIAYGNGCAALVASDSGYNANADVTLDHATLSGMTTCSHAGHGQCHVVYSACSPPQPAQ